MNILGCRITEAIIASWERRMVAEREPIFITAEERRWLPPGSLILTAAEFRENHVMAPLDLFDSYDLYRMNRQGLEVLFLTPAEIGELSEEARLALMALQLERGRGQIYPDGWLRKVGASLPFSGRDRFVNAAGGFFGLRWDAWWALSPEERRRWLLHFVSEGRNSCLSGDLSPDQWEWIDRLHGPQIRHLAGTFAPVSGPNCYAATLAAATRCVSRALSIAGHWLHPEPFLRGLAERGYAVSAYPADPSMPAGSVLLFVDKLKRPQHAAYYLGEGLVLNKDAQSWFAPRQIRTLSELMEEWLGDGMRALVYVRG
ncbi:MAG: hypothetical protein ACOY93_04885 [Bacillota bacterium]